MYLGRQWYSESENCTHLSTADWGEWLWNLFADVRVNVHMYVCVHYMCVCVCVCMHVYVCVWMYVCVCVCACVCVCMHECYVYQLVDAPTTVYLASLSTSMFTCNLLTYQDIADCALLRCLGLSPYDIPGLKRGISYSRYKIKTDSV